MMCTRCYATPCECNKTEVWSGLGNYYGGVYVVKDGDKYFMCVQDHSEDRRKQVSEEFYLAFKKEFGGR